MIIFFAGGRIGNQIFQYMFINTIRRNGERLFASGFDKMMEIFEVKDVMNISRKNRLLRGVIFRLMYPIVDFLSTVRVITRIEVDYEDPPGYHGILPRRESKTYSVKKGILKNIRFVTKGYFQSEYFFDANVTNNIKIKNEYLAEAQKFLNDIQENSNKVFIHIRRGDYKDFYIYGKGTLLPIEYYKKCIDYFTNNYKDCYFVILSDDIEFVNKEFEWLKNKKLSIDNHPGTDLAIITKCKDGVLSTSTFGWWAAYLIKDKGTIFAPRYWIGFNSKIDFPIGGFPRFAKDVEI